MPTGGVIRELRGRLELVGDRDRANGAKRYLKSDLVFLGVTLPDVRREAKVLARARPDLDRDELRVLVSALWRTGIHEMRSVAIGLLEIRADLLIARDASFLVGLVRDSRTWAYVDWLAIKVLGPLLLREPRLGAHVDRWATDRDFWVRRTALLVFHDPLVRGEGDFDHFARLATPMLGEKEFFIRKAIGWVLRSTTKRSPERTIRYVEAHAQAMSGLTFREATRNLPPRTQARLRGLRAAAGDLSAG